MDKLLVTDVGFGAKFKSLSAGCVRQESAGRVAARRSAVTPARPPADLLGVRNLPTLITYNMWIWLLLEN